MQYDLGYFDEQTCKLEPLDNPFGEKSVTHVFGIICNLCIRYTPPKLY